MAFLAPEAAGAAEAAGEARAAKRAGAAKRRPGSAAVHRAQIDQIKARRPDPAMKVQPEDNPAHPSNNVPTVTEPKPEPSRVFTSMDPVHTGSGFVLGTLAWVVFMNYLRGGMPQVRRWGSAKFLNKVVPAGGTK